MIQQCLALLVSDRWRNDAACLPLHLAVCTSRAALAPYYPWYTSHLGYSFLAMVGLGHSRTEQTTVWRVKANDQSIKLAGSVIV
ncbi:hypothetical protein E2C01_035473 [Portunus trituberculatus]|uniref:Uncharacterized protein n=1 Tax=Portunus trituberculatus TaxID=210409 RepID=A0A5B7F994_PORTR|nr:hypothetical protein [Portunus trituberculatus]